jgi:hypothetical protein
MNRSSCRNAIVVLGCLAGTAPATAQVLNEIRTDNSGLDIDEYVEIAGASGTSLGNLDIVVLGDDVEGTGSSSGVVEEVVDLSGRTIDSSSYFVIAENTFTLGTADLVADLSFEEDDNVTFLLVQGFTGAIGDDLDTNDDGVLDGTPWTAIVDRIAIIVQDNPPLSTEYHYGPPAVGPDDTFSPAHVYRCPDGAGANATFQIGQFSTLDGQDTPGAANSSCPNTPPPDAGVPDPPDGGAPADAGADLDAGPGGGDGGPSDMPDAAPGDSDAGPGMGDSDAGPGMGDSDAGPGEGGGGGSDGGCCNVSGDMPTSNLLLVLMVGGLLFRRRLRASRAR